MNGTHREQEGGMNKEIREWSNGEIKRWLKSYADTWTGDHTCRCGHECCSVSDGGECSDEIAAEADRRVDAGRWDA